MPDVLAHCEHHRDVIFESHFGDPLSWSTIYPTAKLLAKDNKKVTIITHGSLHDLDGVEELARLGVSFILKIDGYENAGCVYLGQSTALIHALVSRLGEQCTVIVALYEHNLNDSYSVLEHLGATVVSEAGFVYGDGVAPVIDQDGEWLYDVYQPGVRPDKPLERTLAGHSMIRYYMKQPGPPLNGGRLPRRFAEYAEPVDRIDLYRSVDGVLHPDRDHWEDWNNAGCDDWNESIIDVSKDHERQTAGRLYKYGKVEIDQLGGDQKTVLESEAWRYLTNPTVS